MTVGAVYEDYPWNSTFHDYDVMLSMATQRSFSYDGQDNLVGNDRYRSFIKVAEGCNPELGDFDATVKSIVNKFLKELKKEEIDFSLAFTPISEYTTRTATRNRCCPYCLSSPPWFWPPACSTTFLS